MKQATSFKFKTLAPALVAGVSLCALAFVPLHTLAADAPAAKQAPAPDASFQAMEKSMMQIQNEMNHMFNDSFSQAPDELLRANALFSPAVNISDKDGKYTVTVDVPGVDASAIVATVNGNTLTVSSDMKKQTDEKGKDYIRHESTVSAFERVIQLPDAADVDKAEATYKNGQVIVTMPKSAETKKLSRRLDIKPAG